MSRRRRFLHLERDRDAPAEGVEPRLQREGPLVAPQPEGKLARFGADSAPVEPSPDGAPPARSGATLERFSTSGDAALRTDAAPQARVTGSRCYRCEREFGRFDVSCRTCGAPLDSPEQQAFTLRLANERAALVAQEQEEVARRQEAQRKALEEADRLLRQARENGGLFGDPMKPPSPFPAQRWLRSLVPDRAQQGLIRLALLLLGCAWLVGALRGGGLGRLISLGLGGFLVWAFLPRWWQRTPPANGPPAGPGL